jgi:hypothetical protein
MIDKYTKAVLTVIAVALLLLVAENLMQRANAQSGCGTFQQPCVVTTEQFTNYSPFVTVKIKN